MVLKRLQQLRVLIFSRIGAFGIITVAVTMPAFITSGMVSADAMCNYNNNNSYCLYAQPSGSNAQIITCNGWYGGGPDGCAPYFEFSILGAGGGNTEIVNSNYSRCIGDYLNNSSTASAGLDECPTQGSAGWGTNFTYGFCSNPLGDGYSFHNNHWNGYLGPQSFTDNVKYYLNKPSSYCFADNPE